MLGVPALHLCSGSIPSEKDLHGLQKHVAALEQEKVTRSCTLALLREDIVAKLNLLNVQPEGQLEIQLINDQKVFVLSEGNIKEMKSFLERLKQLEEARRRELAGLLDQLTLFLDRLNIPPEDQDRIRSSSTGLTVSALAAHKKGVYGHHLFNDQAAGEGAPSTSAAMTPGGVLTMNTFAGADN